MQDLNTVVAAVEVIRRAATLPKGGSNEPTRGFISGKHELPESARHGLSLDPEDPGLPAYSDNRVDRRAGPVPARQHAPAPRQVRPLRGARRRRPGPRPVQHRRDVAVRPSDADMPLKLPYGADGGS